MSSRNGKTSHVHGVVVLGSFKEGPHGSPRSSPRISASALPGGLLETNTFYWVLQYLNSRDLKGSLWLGETSNSQRTTETCWIEPGRVPFSPLGTGCLDTLRGLWTLFTT